MQNWQPHETYTTDVGAEVFLGLSLGQPHSTTQPHPQLQLFSVAGPFPAFQSCMLKLITLTWAAEPVRLVRFWPDHFFALLIIHKMRGVSLGSICFLEITAIFSLCLVKHSSAAIAC